MTLKHIKQTAQRGFTLLEVLLVVAIIAILAGIVIIAINPSKNLADTRNAQRQQDLSTILDAVYQYALDNNGQVPGTITTTSTELCKTSTSSANCTSSGFIDLTTMTTSGKYIASLPIDPSNPSASNGTGYKINKDANGRIVVTAPNSVADGKSPAISVTR